MNDDSKYVGVFFFFFILLTNKFTVWNCSHSFREELQIKRSTNVKQTCRTVIPKVKSSAANLNKKIPSLPLNLNFH